MKVLITGASGFLGGHLVDGFHGVGHRVRAMVRPSSDTTRLLALPDVDLVVADLNDPVSLRGAVEGVDLVCHSAARVADHGTRHQFERENVEGTVTLLKAAEAAGVSRFVHISSPSALMGPDDGDRLDIDESTPYPSRWLNLYSATKAAAEQHVLAADRPGFTTLALRPRGIWGPRDHAGFLPRLVARMAAGRLPDLSAGKRVLVSLCHCDNAVYAALRASCAPAAAVGGRPYFIADDERIDLWPFLAHVAELLDIRPPSRRVPPPVRDALAAAVDALWSLPPLSARRDPPLSRYSVALLTRSATYNTAAARRDLGYRPITYQEAGLKQLVAWIRSNGGTDWFARAAR